MPCTTGSPVSGGETGGGALQGTDGGGGWGGQAGGGPAPSSGLVQPFGALRGLARVHVHGLLAVLALHGAAPFKLALTLGDLLHSRGVVAPPAAHDLAAVRAARRLVADAPSCAQGACKRGQNHTINKRSISYLDSQCVIMTPKPVI